MRRLIGSALAPLRKLIGWGDESEIPRSLVAHRSEGKRTAVVFIHGFTGRSDETWGEVIQLLMEDPTTKSWDIYSLGYPARLRLDIPNVWSADPGLDLVAKQLGTTLNLPPLADYPCLAIAAHSMGGLALQRLVCDHADVRQRLQYVFLYGVPSMGLVKARLISFAKRQFKDMAPESAFIRKLRRDWKKLFGGGTGFTLRVVAGERDEFVAGDSSLRPFADQEQRVVPGDHSTILTPLNRTDQRYSIIAGALSGRETAQTAVDGAEVALELRRFQSAVDTLYPRRDDLDDNAIVTLALALEGVGRGGDALAVMENHYSGRLKSSSEVTCVLAGRLKRQWLAGGLSSDFNRSHELYSQALAQAEADGDHSQAFYSAINVAFLELIASPPASSVPSSAEAMAKRALEHCEFCRDDVWKMATIGEARMVLGQREQAVAAYRQAAALASPREIGSIAKQAVWSARRIYGRSGAEQIEELFGYKE